jgi:hypothetical protein
MKPTPDDPRLTAYLLGELTPEEAEAIRHAIAADPALGLAVAELEHVQRLLGQTLAPESAALLPRQRAAVLNAARHADAAGKIMTFPPRRKPAAWAVPLAAAALIALAVFLLIRLPAGPEKLAKSPPRDADANAPLPLEIALLPAPGPPDASQATASEPRPAASSDLARQAAARATALRENGDLFLRKVAERLATSPLPDARQLPPIVPRGRVNPATSPTLPLPVHAGRASLGWVSRSILQDRKRPPASAVRIEEMLNHFPLRTAGPAAVVQGVTLSTESIACPWKPSATLILVTFRGASDAPREVEATFHADPASVRIYRLLGFAPVAGLTPAPLPTRLPAGEITSLMIELEPSAPGANPGTIEWSVNGNSAPAIQLIRHADAEPSNDARFAALVCTYALWLTGGESGLIDTELLAALARENAADTLPADRMDFLNLIDRSLGL